MTTQLESGYSGFTVMDTEKFERYYEAQELFFTGLAVMTGTSRIKQIYMLNGMWHRLDGPAAYYADKNKCMFWINDRHFSEQDYWNHPKVVAHKLKEILNDTT